MGNRYSCDPSACQAATDQSKVGTCTITHEGMPVALNLHQNTCNLLGGTFGTPPDPCPADGSAAKCFEAVATRGVGPFGTFAVFNQSTGTTVPGLPGPGKYSVYECEAGSCSRTAPAKIPTAGLIPLCVGAGLPPNSQTITTVECPGCRKGAVPSPACTAEIDKFSGSLPPEAFAIYNNTGGTPPPNSGLPAQGHYVVGACIGTGPQEVCSVSATGPIPATGQAPSCGKNVSTVPVSVQPCKTGK